VSQPWGRGSGMLKNPATSNGILAVCTGVSEWIFHSMSDSMEIVLPHKGVYETAACYKGKANVPVCLRNLA